MTQDFPEIVKRGKAATIYLYKLNSGDWVVADQAGWLPGSFSTREEALTSALIANGIEVRG